MNWYAGQKSITHLLIESESLKIIKPYAFSSEAFLKLVRLTFLMDSCIKYTPAMWAGLYNLRTLIVGDSHIFVTEAADYLLMLKRNLHTFVSNFGYTEKDVNFNCLFGTGGLYNLHYVNIRFIRPQHDYRKILAADNFTAFRVIEGLQIVDCGIETILENAFQYIGETLIKLNLSRNKITAIFPTIFNVFFDTDRRHLKPTFDDRFLVKILNLTGNPLKCNCDLYEIRHLTLTNVGEESWSTMKCTGGHMGHNYENETAENCRNLQVVHTKRVPLNTLHADKYFYPRFDVKLLLKEVSLIIKSENRDKFRLLIRNYSNIWHAEKECSKRKCSNELAECLSFQNLSVGIPIHKYLQTELTTICIVYANADKLVWPLHCITIHRSIERLDAFDFLWSENNLLIFILTIASIAGLWIGLLLAVSIVHLKMKSAYVLNPILN